jgi:hypothetical protein
MSKLSIAGVYAALLIMLVCIGGEAETCQLGSHRISFNLGEPAEMKIEVPESSPSTGEGWYGLNITPSSGGSGFVKVRETTETLGSDTIQNLSTVLKAYTALLDIERYMDAIIDYKGNTALSTYTPTQSKSINGTTYNLTNVGYSLWYSPDENTIVVIESHTLSNTTYTKLLDSFEITKMHKPYVGPTSGYAGSGLGAKPGFENQNILSETRAKEG